MFKVENERLIRQ